MKTGYLRKDITNTILDRAIVMAPAGAVVTILEEFDNYYEVAYYGGESPSQTFYVLKSDLQVSQ